MGLPLWVCVCVHRTIHRGPMSQPKLLNKIVPQPHPSVSSLHHNSYTPSRVRRISALCPSTGGKTGPVEGGTSPCHPRAAGDTATMGPEQEEGVGYPMPSVSHCCASFSTGDEACIAHPFGSCYVVKHQLSLVC